MGLTRGNRSPELQVFPDRIGGGLPWGAPPPVSEAWPSTCRLQEEVWRTNEVLTGGNLTRDLDRTWRWSCSFCWAAASCDRWTVIWLPSSDHMNNQKRIFYWCSSPSPFVFEAPLVPWRHLRRSIGGARSPGPTGAPEETKTNSPQWNRWLSFQSGRKIPRDLWPPNRLAALTVGNLLWAVAGINVTQIW